MDLHSSLSANFSLAELLRTSLTEYREEQNNPPPGVLLNLRRLCVDLLQPARDLVGRLHVNSGYRCLRLNSDKRIQGAKQSAHLDGLAADIDPLDMHIVDAFMRISKSAAQYDKLILESKSPDRVWIHMQVARHWKAPRRQLLMKFPDSEFESFNRYDPRVKEIK